MKNKILKPFLLLTVALTITSCGSKEKINDKENTQIEEQHASKNKPAKNTKEEGKETDPKLEDEEVEELITELEDSQKDMEDLREEVETKADKNS